MFVPYLSLCVVGGVLHLEVERDVSASIAVVGLGQRQRAAVDAVVVDEVLDVNVGCWHVPAPSPALCFVGPEQPSPPVFRYAA
jgi:hypothetical protein